MATKGNTLFYRSPFKIVIPYFIVSVLWIYFSDNILKALVYDINLLSEIQTFKGIAYIAITATLLYFLVKHDRKAIASSYRDKIEQDHIYHALIENGYDLIILSDGNGNNKYSSDNVGWMFGYSEDEFRKMNLHRIIHPEDYAMIKLINEEMIVNPGKIYNAEFRALHKNGSVLWIEARMVNHLNDPAIKGIITHAKDISKRKEAQNALIQLNKELEQKVKERTTSLIEALEKEKKLNEMKSRFVSFASHEFRTPLTGILASASLIKLYPNAEQQDKRVRHLDRIAASVSNLTDILTDFLSVEQLEHGTIERKINLFNLPVFIDEVITDMDGMLSKKNQRIKYHHNGVVMVRLSEKILRNIMLNLLSNASKYSAFGEEILFTTSVADNRATISVQDHGIGISEEDQKKIFTSYFRGGNVDNVEGTGLGLSIVKKYVELLDGNITFTSRLEKGTTFTMEFPQVMLQGNNYHLTDDASLVLDA